MQEITETTKQPAKKYYWLKLKRDFFKRHDIRIIENQENGKDYVLFYLKMLVESIDHEGELRFNEAIPYDEKMLAVITNTNIDIVRAAMQMFVGLQMIELLDDKTIFMSEVTKLIGSETASAERVRKHRAKQGMAEIKSLPAPVAKTNAERQRSFRAKKSCEEKQHVPFIEDYMNNVRYGGNYYIVMKRDKFKCVICNSIEKLCVHHIDGYDENKHDNNSENKMVTLCRTCHSQTHAGAKIPEDVLDSIDYYTVTESCNADVTKCNTELETESESNKEMGTGAKAPKPIKHKHGEYNNVLLTDEQLQKLKNEFADWQQRIERLSEYMASTGKSYKDHLATIRAWARKEPPKSERAIRVLN